MQQMNLAFAVDRLEKAQSAVGCGHVVASRHWARRLGQQAADPPPRSGWRCRSLAGHADELPEIASLLLTNFVERGEVPPFAAFSTAPSMPCARTLEATAGMAELERPLCAGPQSGADRAGGGDQCRRRAPGACRRKRSRPSEAPPCSRCFDQPLREARDAFERLYFEHHLRLEGGNMTKLAEASGLERTHLYRKLKQLDVKLGKRGEE
jgi:two-component system nitrogen regulation response regulator NtrX